MAASVTSRPSSESDASAAGEGALFAEDFPDAEMARGETLAPSLVEGACFQVLSPRMVKTKLKTLAEARKSGGRPGGAEQVQREGGAFGDEARGERAGYGAVGGGGRFVGDAECGFDVRGSGCSVLCRRRGEEDEAEVVDAVAGGFAGGVGFAVLVPSSCARGGKLACGEISR